jgi:hypothetical protein
MRPGAELLSPEQVKLLVMGLLMITAGYSLYKAYTWK